MAKRSSLMSKVMVLLLAFAVVFTYSVMPMNQAYAASGKKPAKVAIKSATATSSTTVQVKWKKAKNAKKYEVYYSTKSKKGFKKGATVKGAKKVTAVVKNLKPSTKYYFKVRAVNGKKKGKYSKVKAATTQAAPAPAPAPSENPASEDTADLGERLSRTMTYNIDMTDATRYPKGSVVEVWVPVPSTDKVDGYQTISNEKVEAEGAATAVINTEEKYGNRMAYIKWDAETEPAARKATVSFDAERFAVSRSDLKEDASAGIPADVKPFITEESTFVKVNDPIVKKYAAEATNGKTGTLEKARAIYEWVINHLERIDDGETLVNKDGESKTFAVEGCGYGDTVQILTDLEKFGRAGGHCTDINSTFVALCRASGIPAKEMFGLRMNTDATGGQHCWAQFYLPGTGWVFADPGDVLKNGVRTKSGMTVEEVEAARQSEKAKSEMERLWGGVEANRVQLSTGRDVVLNPPQKADPRNTFGYPYAEVDGKTETTFDYTGRDNAPENPSNYRNVDAQGDYINCTKGGSFKYTIDGVDAPVENEVLVDARTPEVYAGWAVDGNSKGGHLDGAVNIAAQWLDMADADLWWAHASEKKSLEDAIDMEIEANGLEKDATLTVYDTNGSDAKKVAKYLRGKGFTNVAAVNKKDEIEASDSLISYDNYKLSVPAEVVKNISDYKLGKAELSDAAKQIVGDANKDNIKLLHAEYAASGKYAADGSYDKDAAIDWTDGTKYYNGHVPGAVPISTDDFEPEAGNGRDVVPKQYDDVYYGVDDSGAKRTKCGWAGNYMLRNDDELIMLAGKYGINKGDVVVVAGYEPMATTRIAVILKYLGVDNTYIMSGAYNEWILKGYESEAKVVNKPEPGTDITEVGNPDVIDTQDEADAKLKDAGWQLIDTRTKDEFDGIDTGYGYHDIAGRIENTVLSESGVAWSSSMYFYRNPDSSMRSANVLKAKWDKEGVKYGDKKLSFFCGSGWRASEEVWDAWVLGYEDASLFSDGWQGWSNAERPFIDKEGKTVKLNKASSKIISVNAETITAEELMAALSSGKHNGKTLKILDVRKAEDFAKGHIVTASSADVEKAVDGSDADAAKANVEAAIKDDAEDTAYALICYSGNAYANKAAEILMDLGKDPANIFILAQDDGTQGKNGGMNAWNAKYPAFTGTATFDAEEDFVVDVRDKDAYDTAHIQGAYNAPVRGEDYATNLDKAYQKADGRRLVIVCYTGFGLAKKSLLYFQGKEGVDMSKVTYLIGGDAGYTGTKIPTFSSIAAKDDPVWVEYGISKEDFDDGREFDDFYIVDVRDATTYADGNYEGSVNVALGDNISAAIEPIEAGSEVAKKLDKAFENAYGQNQAVVIICYGGNKWAKAAMDYLYNAYPYVTTDEVTYLIGGYQAD